MEIYKLNWMVFDALGCMNNADFEKNSKCQHCSRCIYFMLEITAGTSNFQKGRTRRYSLSRKMQ